MKKTGDSEVEKAAETLKKYCNAHKWKSRTPSGVKG